MPRADQTPTISGILHLRAAIVKWLSPITGIKDTLGPQRVGGMGGPQSLATRCFQHALLDFAAVKNIAPILDADNRLGERRGGVFPIGAERLVHGPTRLLAERIL